MRTKFESVFGELFDKFLKNDPEKISKKEKKDAEALKDFLDGFNRLRK
jgi:hypothetical protein